MDTYPRKQYSTYYKYISESPENSVFHRFTEEWGWVLNRQIFEILRLKAECKAMMAQSEDCLKAGFDYDVTDWHPAYMGNDKKLKRIIGRIEQCIRKYTRDAISATQMAQLPDQSELWAAAMRKHPNIFDDGIFGPTGESAERYRQCPANSDLFTLKGFEENKVTTRCALGVYVFLRNHIWLRIFPHKPPTTEVAYAHLDVVDAVVDLFICVLLPLVFIAALYSLYIIQSINVRIAVIGGFGILIMLFLKVTTRAKRVELFTLCAAYFAISSVFVTITSEKNGRV